MAYPEYPEKEKSVPSVDSTENGKTRESDYSLPVTGEKVKSAPPLDLYTEMFMLNVVQKTLRRLYVDKDTRWEILPDLISGCAEANEA